MDVVLYRRITDPTSPLCGKLFYLGHEHSTNGVHSPEGNPPTKVDWAIAAARCDADFYDRHGIPCEHWMGILKGTTVEWEKIIFSDSFPLKVHLYYTVGPNVHSFEYHCSTNKRELWGLLEEESRKGHSVLVVSRDGRQDEVNAIVKEFSHGKI